MSEKPSPPYRPGVSTGPILHAYVGGTYNTVLSNNGIVVGTGLTIREPNRMLIDLGFEVDEVPQGAYRARCMNAELTHIVGRGLTEASAIRAAQCAALTFILESLNNA